MGVFFRRVMTNSEFVWAFPSHRLTSLLRFSFPCLPSPEAGSPADGHAIMCLYTVSSEERCQRNKTAACGFGFV